jgi:hypothetical protein
VLSELVAESGDARLVGSIRAVSQNPQHDRHAAA